MLDSITILDSGCSKTVAGKLWASEYLKTLPEKEVSFVVRKNSNSVFRFGDGKDIKSIELLTVPVLICGQRFLLDIEVVENDIPLLISKGPMKVLCMQVDFV